jgi:hypothetical protein
MSPGVLLTAGRYQLAAVAVLGAVTLALWPAIAPGTVAGGIVMAANFWFLRTMATRIFTGPADRAKAVYAVLLGMKLVLALAAIAVLVLLLELDPVGLALGLSTLFIGVGAATVHQVLAPARS